MRAVGFHMRSRLGRPRRLAGEGTRNEMPVARALSSPASFQLKVSGRPEGNGFFLRSREQAGCVRGSGLRALQSSVESANQAKRPSADRGPSRRIALFCF